MATWADGPEKSRALLRQSGRKTRDVMRQIERNGGRTDAEIYALKHAAALEDLYVRAGLALPGNIREEIERVRAHEEGLRAAEGRGE